MSLYFVLKLTRHLIRLQLIIHLIVQCLSFRSDGVEFFTPRDLLHFPVQDLLLSLHSLWKVCGVGLSLHGFKPVSCLRVRRARTARRHCFRSVAFYLVLSCTLRLWIDARPPGAGDSLPTASFSAYPDSVVARGPPRFRPPRFRWGVEAGRP